MANISNFITPAGSGGGGGGSIPLYGNQQLHRVLAVGAGGTGGVGGLASSIFQGGGGGGGGVVETQVVMTPGVKYRVQVGTGSSTIDTDLGDLVSPRGGKGSDATANNPGDEATGGGSGVNRNGSNIFVSRPGAAADYSNTVPIGKGLSGSLASINYGTDGNTGVIDTTSGAGGTSHNPITDIISTTNATTAAIGHVFTSNFDNEQYVAFGVGAFGRGTPTNSGLWVPRFYPYINSFNAAGNEINFSSFAQADLDVDLHDTAPPPNSGFGGFGGNRTTPAATDGASGVVIFRTTSTPTVYTNGRTIATLGTDYLRYTEDGEIVTVFKADGFIEFPTT